MYATVGSMANGAADYLMDCFQFKIAPGASCVTDRRSVSYSTAGSIAYTSNSRTKEIGIIVTSRDGWLDP